MRKFRTEITHLNFFIFYSLVLSGAVINQLFTVPTEIFSTFTNVGNAYLGTVIDAGWKVLGVVVLVYAGKSVIGWARGLFKKSFR